MSAKCGDDRDPYLYPTLDVLRNRLGIRQAQRLQQTAWEFTSLRAATMPLGPRGRGLPHLCAIHRQLYQDLFDWAGNAAGNRYLPGRYAVLPLRVDRERGQRADAQAGEEDYLCEQPRETFVERLSWFYGEINVLHPFSPWQRPDPAHLLRTAGHTRRLPARLAGR